MRILVLDVETTGLKAGRDALLEVGAALFDSTVKQTLWMYSTIMPILIDNPAESINHISKDALQAAVNLYDWRPAFTELDGALAPVLQLCDAGAVDVCCAHNKDFDKGFIDALAENPPLLRGIDRVPIPWFCTKDGINYPQQGKAKSLRYLAVDHGIPIGSQRHRALADVMLVCDLLTLAEDLDAQVLEALKPQSLFQALVSFDDRELAKKAGFRWNGPAKRWEKKMSSDTPQQPVEERPFPIRMLG